MIQVHRKSHDRACADSVRAKLVAQLIRLGNRRQVIDATIGAEGRERLVFGASVMRVDATRLVLDYALTAYRAGEARLAFGHDRIEHDLAADIVSGFEEAAVIVV